MQLTHSEDPSRRRHFAVSSLRVGHNSQIVALSKRQASHVRFQFTAKTDGGIVGRRHVLVTLPDTHFIADQRFFFNSRRHISPIDSNGRRIDRHHLNTGRRFQRRLFECTLQKLLTLGPFTCKNNSVITQMYLDGIFFSVLVKNQLVVYLLRCKP